MRELETKNTPLPFAHGIEIELQVIKRDGSWFKGEEVLDVFDRLISQAKGNLDKKVREATIKSVREKYVLSSQTEEGERGSRIIVQYRNSQGEAQEYTLIGHDPNVTSLTWILEIATPPCTFLEELAWWIQTLVSISYESLPVDVKAILVSTGLNPTQEYLRNLSFGEHHHILSPDIPNKTKLGIYNMVRNFIPHLIALSVNSPFEKKRATDVVSIDSNNRTRAPKCKRSIRLLRNTTQLGPTNEFEFIPHLDSLDVDEFSRHVNRSPSRMVDVYPFTDYGTIEIRVFDTQLSIPRRVGIAVILQALALRAKRIVEGGGDIPDIGASSLTANRASAVAAGLWGPFHAGSGDNEFVQVYNHKIDEMGTIQDSNRNRFLGDAVESMLYLIRGELEELDAVDNPFLQPLLTSVFGSEFVEQRTTGADFQLDTYAKSGLNMISLMKELVNITRECSTNWLYDPLEGTPKLPTWLCWWKGIEHDIILDETRVFAGQDATFDISLKNTAGRELRNVVLSYVIEDSERHQVESDVITVPNMLPGAINISKHTFKTRRTVTAYNILASVTIADRQLSFSSTINTYWVKMDIRPTTMTQFADGVSPLIFSGKIETNYPSEIAVDCDIAVIAPQEELILGVISGKMVLQGGDVHLLQGENLPPLVIPLLERGGVLRCNLRGTIRSESGEELALSTSRPFFVGFAGWKPQLALRINESKDWHPGDLIQGDVFIRNQGTITPDTILVVSFVDSFGKEIEVARTRASDYISDSFLFQWRVPPPSIPSSNAQSGRIRAALVKDGSVVDQIESESLKISQPVVRASIDSLKVPRKTRIGGKVSGWLRIRRNTELGQPANLKLLLRFENDEEHVLLQQTVKQSRNLSIAYGPLVIPKSRSILKPRVATFEAQLSYGGVLLDSKSAQVILTEQMDESFATIEYTRMPRFVYPGNKVETVLQIQSTQKDPKQCLLTVTFDTIAGRRTLLKRDTEVGSQLKLFPLSLRVPLSAEMSTGTIFVSLKCNDREQVSSKRFKIKAIDKPLFHISHTIKNASGSEVPGLAPRGEPLSITVDIRSECVENINIIVKLRIMNRRTIVKEFMLPWVEEESDTFQKTVKWETPEIDIVTAYYLQVSVMEGERSLPSRAIEQQEKQFTVY